MIKRSRCYSLLAVCGLVIGCGSVSKDDDHKKGGPRKEQTGTGEAQFNPTGLCVKDYVEICREHEKKLTELRQRRDEAINAGNQNDAVNLSLEINYIQELLGLYNAGKKKDSAEAQRAEAKYQALQKLFASRSGETIDGSAPYSESEEEVMKKVRDDFGDLYIGETKGRVKWDAKLTPWSSYWFPFRDDVMYRDGTESPLGKFDRLVSTLHPDRSSHALSTEKEFIDLLGGTKAFGISDGLCHAWALAAILNPEPLATPAGEDPNKLLAHPSAPDIKFSRNDLKALLIKSYENTTPERSALKQYGVRYMGNDKSDGSFQDLRPDAFHRIAESVIGVQKRAIAMDTYATAEVWTHPVYGLHFDSIKDPEVENAYRITATLYYVNYMKDPDSRPSSDIEDNVNTKYEYRLYVDPKDERDGKYRVIYGEWINRSRFTHPDFVLVGDDSVKPVPQNKELEANLDVIKELLSQGVEVQ